MEPDRVPATPTPAISPTPAVDVGFGGRTAVAEMPAPPTARDVAATTLPATSAVVEDLKPWPTDLFSPWGLEPPRPLTDAISARAESLQPRDDLLDTTPRGSEEGAVDVALLETSSSETVPPGPLDPQPPHLNLEIEPMYSDALDLEEVVPCPCDENGLSDELKAALKKAAEKSQNGEPLDDDDWNAIFCAICCGVLSDLGWFESLTGVITDYILKPLATIFGVHGGWIEFPGVTIDIYAHVNHVAHDTGGFTSVDVTTYSATGSDSNSSGGGGPTMKSKGTMRVEIHPSAGDPDPPLAWCQYRHFKGSLKEDTDGSGFMEVHVEGGDDGGSVDPPGDPPPGAGPDDYPPDPDAPVPPPRPGAPLPPPESPESGGGDDPVPPPRQGAPLPPPTDPVPLGGGR